MDASPVYPVMSVYSADLAILTTECPADALRTAGTVVVSPWPATTVTTTTVMDVVLTVGFREVIIAKEDLLLLLTHAQDLSLQA